MGKARTVTENYQGDGQQQQHANGRHPDTHPVTFGDAPHQELTVEVASAILTLWRQRSAGTFGAYLSEVLTGTKPQGSRGGK